MKEWTEARRKAFIMGALRSGFRRYPAKYECLKQAFVGKKINENSGRICSHYRCGICLGEFPTKEVQVDHINPIVNPDDGFVSWDAVVENLYCDITNLQVLCKPCHKEKTNNENKKRKQNVNNKKNNSQR